MIFVNYFISTSHIYTNCNLLQQEAFNGKPPANDPCYRLKLILLLEIFYCSRKLSNFL